MKNKTKFLISILVITLLMVGSVSGLIISPHPDPDEPKGKQAFQLGYDCYREPGVYWLDCKQVEHKRDWFIKKGFYRRLGEWYPCGDGWMCAPHVWHRYPK